jgi:hypothetical protein
MHYICQTAMIFNEISSNTIITAGLSRYLNADRLFKDGLGSMGNFKREINRQVIDVPVQKIDD